MNKIIDECISDGTLVTTDARSISRHNRLATEVKYRGDLFGGREPENQDTTRFKEIDHVKSVKNGGGSDIDNLEYISKINNRRKGAN